MYVRGFGFSERRRARPMASETNNEVSIGNRPIRTLSKGYDTNFPEGCRDDEKLRDAVQNGRAIAQHAHIWISSRVRCGRFAGRPLNGVPRPNGRHGLQ
jgi:hypothetical protein